MNQQLEFQSLLPPPVHPSPAVLLLALATRIRQRLPEMAISAHWLVTWARATLRSLSSFSLAARAVDDPLERVTSLLNESLRNDTPAHRRTILRAVAQVHRRSELLAARLEPHCPERYLQDGPAK